MTCVIERAAPVGSRDDPRNVHSFGGCDNFENSPTPSHRQEAFAHLRRDFIAEALRVAAIKASHAADDIAQTSRQRDVPRLRIKIAVSTDRVPYGQSRQFYIRKRDIGELLGTAERLERRS